MPEEFPVNRQRLPDGTERIVATNEAGMLLIEHIGREVRVVYERKFPELVYDDLTEPVVRYAAVADLQSQRLAFDHSVARDLISKVADLLDSTGPIPRHSEELNVRDSIGHDWNDTTWIVRESRSRSTGKINMSPETSVGTNVVIWLRNAVERLADARENAVANITREWDDELATPEQRAENQRFREIWPYD